MRVSKASYRVQGDELLSSGERVYYDDNGVRYVIDDERRRVRKARIRSQPCLTVPDPKSARIEFALRLSLNTYLDQSRHRLDAALALLQGCCRVSC